MKPKVATEIYSAKDYVLIKVPLKVEGRSTSGKGIDALRGGLKDSFKDISSVDLQHKIASFWQKAHQ